MPGRAVAVALLLVAVLAPPAAAQDRDAATPTPSGSELRQMYPLKPSTAAPTITATPEASVTPTVTPQPAPPPSRSLLQLAVVVMLAALAFAAGLLALRRRRGARKPRVATVLPSLRYVAAPLLSASGAATMGSSGPRPPRRAAALAGGVPPGNPVPRPPDPRREWTAEIEWRHTDQGSRFTVVARTQGEEPVVLAQSIPLEWPPTTPTAVQALTDAAGDLEAALIAAGWRPLEPGAAWYAKRFGWRPSAVRALPDPEPPARTGRFTRPAWPEGTELLPRCEIEWRAGYVNSRFEAVVHRPNRRRGRAVAASGAFKWLLMGEPDPASPEHRTELRGLASALAAAGWEPAGRGTHWYAERFVWRREDEPPERVQPATAKEDGA